MVTFVVIFQALTVKIKAKTKQNKPRVVHVEIGAHGILGC